MLLLQPSTSILDKNNKKPSQQSPIKCVLLQNTTLTDMFRLRLNQIKILIQKTRNNRIDKKVMVTKLGRKNVFLPSLRLFFFFAFLDAAFLMVIPISLSLCLEWWCYVLYTVTQQPNYCHFSYLYVHQSWRWKHG